MLGYESRWDIQSRLIIIDANHHGRERHPQKEYVSTYLFHNYILVADVSNIYKMLSELCREINLNKTWTRSLTKHMLTSYAEGLSVACYDRSVQYSLSYIRTGIWLVAHLSIFNLDEERDPLPLQYVRVPRVEVRGDVLTCTCKKYIQTLRPCSHMAAVFRSLGKELEPSHYHIRW